MAVTAVEPRPSGRLTRRLPRWLPAAPALFPAAAVAYLSFRSGGFFPGEPATIAVVLAIFLVLRLTTVERPLAGVSAGVVVAAVALGLLAVWTLVSSAWSGAPARALLEYDRVLAYGLAVIALGTVAGTRVRLAWGTRALLLAFAVVCGAGLVTQLLPDVWSRPSPVADGRLSYPLTYWNAMGAVAAIGTVLAAGLTTSAREPRVVRVLAAALTPLLATTLVLTLSRGAIGAGIIGVLVLLGAARPLGWAGAVAAAAGAALPVVGVLHADLVTSSRYASDAGVHEGHHVMRLLVAGALLAAALRWALLGLDRWALRRADERGALRRSPRRVWAVRAAVASLILAVVLASGAPGFAQRQVDRFVHQRSATDSGSARLLDVSNSGRLDHWRVALDAFAQQPLHGTGAGTFQTRWARYRHDDLDVVDAHSLYIEVLGELGVVGLVLVVVALGALLWGFARLARGRERAIPGTLLAAGVTWAVHAGFDWDWEMPATGFWLFGLGALALARTPTAAGRAWVPGRVPRVAMALACLVIAVVPVLVIASQSDLEQAAQRFARGDCPGTIDSALGSIGALGSRPEPFELMGYCDARLGQGSLAVRALEQAVQRDRNWWETWYGLALVKGAAGQDPRPAAAHALALDPREALPRRAVRAFARGNPRTWPRIAARLRLPAR